MIFNIITKEWAKPRLLFDTSTIPLADFKTTTISQYANSYTSGVTETTHSYAFGSEEPYVGYYELETENGSKVYKCGGDTDFNKGYYQTRTSGWALSSTASQPVFSGFTSPHLYSTAPMHVVMRWGMRGTSGSTTYRRWYISSQTTHSTTTTDPLIMEFDIDGDVISNITGAIPYKPSSTTYVQYFIFDILNAFPLSKNYTIVVTNNSETQYSNIGLIRYESGSYTTDISQERHSIQVGESQTFIVPKSSVTVGTQFQPVEYSGDTQTTINHKPRSLVFSSSVQDYQFEITTSALETLTVIVNSPGPLREAYVANATTGETTASASFAGEYTFTIDASEGDTIQVWDGDYMYEEFTFDGTNPVTVYLST